MGITTTTVTAVRRNWSTDNRGRLRLCRGIATQSMGKRLENLMREHYPKLDVQAFTAANVAHSPLVLIGTFTGVNA